MKFRIVNLTQFVFWSFITAFLFLVNGCGAETTTTPEGFKGTAKLRHSAGNIALLNM